MLHAAGATVAPRSAPVALAGWGRSRGGGAWCVGLSSGPGDIREEEEEEVVAGGWNVSPSTSLTSSREGKS